MISDKDHRESYFSVSRDVYNPTKGRYIHEVMHKPEELPPGSRIRTLSRSGHKIVVGYWDINKFAVLQVLHPKNEAIPCHFRARLENMDIRIRPGEVRRVKGLTRLKKIITINPIRVLLG